jgi:hypothetical protein
MNRIPFAGATRCHLAVCFTYLASLIVLSTPTAVVRAGDPAAGVDAVLLMDSSGSMAKNDPQQLRIPAAKLFMSLLGPSDRLGLISFSDNGYPVLHLTTPGPDTKARILAAADKVSSKGVYTNLYAALDKGVNMLEKEGTPDQDKMLVLMSDGKMDVGDSDEDWKLTQQLKDDLLKRIQDKHIKVYTIAFTEASDVELLKDVAQQSGALFKLAKSATDLHAVFSDIFETAKSPDMLPIEGGEFTVDASIEEVTIVASKEREDVRIFLQSPDGRKFAAEDASDAVKWFLSEHFDMITLHAPQPGKWKLLFSGGRNRAYIVTNMALNHNPQQPNLNAGEDMVLESWLEQDGKLLDKEAVLTNTRFKIKIAAPDGGAAEFDLYDTGQFGDRKAADGVYANTLAYENPGSYRIDIIAEGETFKRQKTVHFDVAPAAATAAKTPPVEPAPPAAATAPADVQTQLEAEPVPATPVAVPDASAESPAADAPVKNKQGLNLGIAIGIFFGINLLLVLLGVGIWWFLKKRKQKTPGPEEEGDAAET